MKRRQFILGLTVGLCLMTQFSWATKAYVSDYFEITLRTGPSIENKIIAMPSSGQPFEVLGSEGDWSHVRMVKADGDSVEGWVLTRYVSTRLPWEVQAKTLSAENASLKEKLAHVEKELNEATNRERDLTRQLKERSEALQRARADYDSLKSRAADYLKLEAAYTENRSTLQTAQADVQRLTEEIRKSRYSQRNRWFLTGALVLLVGLMIGLVIGRQQKRRRTSLYS